MLLHAQSCKSCIHILATKILPANLKAIFSVKPSTREEKMVRQVKIGRCRVTIGSGQRRLTAHMVRRLSCHRLQRSHRVTRPGSRRKASILSSVPLLHMRALRPPIISHLADVHKRADRRRSKTARVTALQRRQSGVRSCATPVDPCPQHH